jgi:primosomal protein N' (replication factor Y)
MSSAIAPDALVEVAPIPPIPGLGCLTYLVPDALRERAVPGARVRVPLGRTSRTGLVVRRTSEAPQSAVKPILECLDPDPFLDDQVLALCHWAATYYVASVADVIATFVPSRAPRVVPARTIRLLRRLDDAEAESLRRRSPRQWTVYRAVLESMQDPLSPATLARIRGWQAPARRLVERGIVEMTTVDPDAAGAAVADAPAGRPEAERPTSFAPTPDQASAIAAIIADVSARRFRVFLLFGVTGSGKTNVYLEAARTALAAGRSVLILSPEIGLAHEAADRARAELGSGVLLLHSALAPRERWTAWRRAGRGDAMVVVGPRSAVFAPLRNLGLVVVDEEHDPSYKQDEGVRYNGRDLAVIRAKLAGCPVVLASATPAVESYHHTRSDRFTLLELRERPGGRPMPAVSLLDLRSAAATKTAPSEQRERAERGECSGALVDAIRETARRHDQALLFLNRRGFAHYVHCLACGEPVTCTACSVTLTLHAGRRALVCHHCGLTRPAHPACGRCGAPATAARGPGTERIEHALIAEFPELRVARMDRDTIGGRGAHARLLRAWHAGEIDVLIGTQMVTKGVDNPRVTLVGVLDADVSLNQPDFRAAERTFQLVSQVAGRAGRGERPGTVMVQTTRPEHYSLVAAAAHDYEALFTAEIAYREALGYPPFKRLVNVRIEARDAIDAERAARDFGATVRARHEGGESTLQVLGPAPAPIERLRGWYRWQVLCRGTSRVALRAAVRHGLAQIGASRRGRRVRIVVDVDPCSML